MDNKIFSRIETEQDGVKVVLEFPKNSTETNKARKKVYHNDELTQEVHRILSHVLKEKLRQSGFYFGERMS